MRTFKEIIKVVAVILAIAAVVGLLGSLFIKNDEEEIPSENESVSLEEESSEPEAVVDHSNCKNEHNWSLYTARNNSRVITGYGYICGVCNTLIHPMNPAIYPSVYNIADLSKAHRFSSASGLTSHFNYVNSGSYVYISSKTNGEQVTTSFPTIEDGSLRYTAKYLALGYRVSDPNASELTLDLVLNGCANSFTVENSFTDGWVYVVLDLSGMDGYDADTGDEGYAIEISFTHTSTLDVSNILLGSDPEIVRNMEGYSGTYFNRGSDFASIGNEVNVE